VARYGIANIDDFVRFLKLFGDFLTKSEWKLTEIGGFLVLFEHPHFQPEKGVEKSTGKVGRFSKNFATKTQRHKEAPKHELTGMGTKKNQTQISADSHCVFE